MTGLSNKQRKALAALHANIGPSGSAFGVSPATLAIILETSPEGAAATASSLVRRNLAERAKASRSAGRSSPTPTATSAATRTRRSR